MNTPERGHRGRVVLAPTEALLAGGPAEDLEQRILSLFRRGFHHVVLDLRQVSSIDSAGVRALVRGHSAAQRLGGTFRIVNMSAEVRGILAVARLDEVLESRHSLEEATSWTVPWRRVALGAAVGATTLGLLGLGHVMQADLTPAPTATPFGGPVDDGAGRIGAWSTYIELLELASAALIGLLVTAVHKTLPRERPMQRSMEQAQVLLCVSGAMMMIIIGNSLARAFGIAGAASIIRFRTPVDDPKDVTILFLLMGLGMACGIGAFSVAGLGTLFLCAALPLLDRAMGSKPRTMMVEITAAARKFPSARVYAVFARHGAQIEPREISQGEEARVRFYTAIPPGVALEDISQALMEEGNPEIKSVEWEAPRRSE